MFSLFLQGEGIEPGMFGSELRLRGFGNVGVGEQALVRGAGISLLPRMVKTSCGVAVVEFQEASQALAGLDLATRFTDSGLRSRK